MTTDIFIVTHLKDKVWLEWCVKSIVKFVRGFHEIVVLVPKTEASHFSIPGIQLKAFDQMPEPRSHLHHCLQKCCADQWCSADFMLYIDADCIFREPVDVTDYFVNGKPVLLMESYDWMARCGNPAVCWKQGTSDVLGFVPTHEFMRRHPAVHCRDLFPMFKAHIEKVHSMPLEKYALSRQASRPVGFNDFNNLGAFAYRFLPERYEFIDITNAPDKRPRDHLIQYWSHGDIGQPQDRWLDGKCESIVPIKEIRSLVL